MDDIINENSYFRDNNKEKKHVHLPKIDLKLIPYQKDINDTSKNENEEENTSKLIRSQTFIISKLTETERKDLKKPKNIFNDEAIVDLLREKIEINPNLSNNNIFLKRLQRNNKKNENKKKNILNRYITENILFNSPIKIHLYKNKLKNIKVSNIFNEVDEDKKDNNDDDSNYDKSLYNIRLYNYLKETEEAKRIKSVNKKIIKKPELEYPKSDWRKNINCSLDYKYLKNRQDISDLNTLLTSKNKNSKLYFDSMRNESNDILEQIWRIKY